MSELLRKWRLYKPYKLRAEPTNTTEEKNDPPEELPLEHLPPPPPPPANMMMAPTALLPYPPPPMLYLYQMVPFPPMSKANPLPPPPPDSPPGPPLSTLPPAPGNPVLPSPPPSLCQKRNHELFMNIMINMDSSGENSILKIRWLETRATLLLCTSDMQVNPLVRGGLLSYCRSMPS